MGDNGRKEGGSPKSALEEAQGARAEVRVGSLAGCCRHKLFCRSYKSVCILPETTKRHVTCKIFRQGALKYMRV